MEIAADAAVASEFIDTLDGQFEHELMQGSTNLSGGQKQRLSMAIAFIRQPEILIFDDSTSAVDALSEAAIQKTLNEDYKQTTKFIISAKVSSIIHARSEEHTSELQSRGHLVCCLLLEKKKTLQTLN